MSEAVNTSGAYIIVTGNEKGGCGKTTVTMHLAVSLLYEGKKVATIDLDARQRSLSRYIENRLKHTEMLERELPQLTHYVVNKSDLPTKAEAEANERSRFEACLNKAIEENDVVIVDAPGNDTYLSRLAHSYADTIVTPINDSFIDLDVIANVKEDTLDMARPGVYSEVVWQAKMQRAKRDRGEIDWVVLRNRLSNLDANNKRQMADALDKLSRKTGCRIAQGFSERVIYRELFLKGLTLLDVMDDKSKVKVRMTHVAARQELRELVHFLDLGYRIAQKTGEETAFTSSGGGGLQEDEALSTTEQVTEEKTEAVEQEALAAVDPLPDVAAEGEEAHHHRHYTIEELAQMEAEIEEREGVIDRLEDLQAQQQHEVALASEEVASEETSVFETAENVADEVVADSTVPVESEAVEAEQGSDAAAAETSNSALSEDTKAKLTEMLAKSKQYVESEENADVSVAEIEQTHPEQTPVTEEIEVEQQPSHSGNS